MESVIKKRKRGVQKFGEIIISLFGEPQHDEIHIFLQLWNTSISFVMFTAKDLLSSLKLRQQAASSTQEILRTSPASVYIAI